MPKGVYRKIECDGCRQFIAANVFNRHVTKSCGKTGYVKKGTLGQWAKGKTKETDERLRLAGEKISISLKGKPGTPRTDVEKRKLSALQSERLKRGYLDGSREQAGGFCKWFEVDGVKVQGTWEMRAANILSKWKTTGRIARWERCPYRITYIVDGISRTYSPDFLITNTDGSEYILEIKGRQSLVDDLKWQAAKASFDLVVWRLKDIQHNERE